MRRSIRGWGGAGTAQWAPRLQRRLSDQRTGGLGLSQDKGSCTTSSSRANCPREDGEGGTAEAEHLGETLKTS